MTRTRHYLGVLVFGGCVAVEGAREHPWGAAAGGHIEVGSARAKQRRVDARAPANELLGAIARVLEETGTSEPLRVDLSAAGAIDSRQLGALIEGHRRATERGATFELRCRAHEPAETLRRLGLDARLGLLSDS
jgi:anti-anti-sigma regulatory factor